MIEIKLDHDILEKLLESAINDAISFGGLIPENSRITTIIGVPWDGIRVYIEAPKTEEPIPDLSEIPDTPPAKPVEL